MKEIKAIIKAYDEADKERVKLALATVVRVEGSSYRRTGARMLVMDNGIWIGGISGGCLEGDALKRARNAIQSATPTLITYDTTDDDPYQIGVGLGCNGVIDVLFTPLDTADSNNPVEVLKRCIHSRRETHVLLTVTGLSGDWECIAEGQVIRYNSDESLEAFGGVNLQRAIREAAEMQLQTGHSAPKEFTTEDSRKLELFIEILPPEIHLVLMGHQYDVYPMSRLIKEMDWRLTIIADPLKINSHIAAIADNVLPPGDLSKALIDNYTAIVLMAHDYKTDKRNLPQVLATEAPYIGMLGPRVRSERIWRELEDDGMTISANNMNRIHAPVGLDIGAVTPEEIALSLIAEVKAALSNRDGAFLRLRQSTIHQRD
ncbi:MAG: XdhC family protein [Bacteroidetes bacterium]|nr:XdhC family protein [Bacteroidota bacterium]